MLWFIIYLLLAYVLYRVGFLIASKIKLNIQDLKSKNVLITGCDTGFGKMTALHLDKLGFRVFAACLTPTAISEYRSDPSVSNRLVPFIMDVTNDVSVQSGLETVRKTLESNSDQSGLYAVVNNAGVLKFSLFEMSSMDDWNLQFNVNVLGLVRVTKAFLPLLKRRGKGGRTIPGREGVESRVINIASVGGRTATPVLSAYCATKYAVQGLSDAVRREIWPWGIKTVIIEPGIMKTPLYKGMFSKEYSKQFFDRLPEEVQKDYGLEFTEHMFHACGDMVEKYGGDPQQVVGAIETGLMAKYPCHRYAIGKDTPVWLFFSYVPGWVADWVFRLQGDKKIQPSIFKDK